MPGVEPRSVLAAVVTAAAAYFIGGIPFGIVVARLVGGRDPRSIGSGRTGGANTLRAIGPRWALLAGLLDAGKGSVAVLLPRLLGFGPALEVLGALVAIVGHSRSPYIGFGGGRGVSVAWGTLLVILVTRISSLGSLIGSLFGAILVIGLVWLQCLAPVYDVYAVGSVALIWIFH